MFVMKLKFFISMLTCNLAPSATYLGTSQQGLSR